MKWVIAALVAITLAGTVYAETAEELAKQGDEYYAQFENRKAFDAYKKAYGLKPDDADILAKLTWSCNNIGEDLDSKESEKYFEQAAEYAKELEKLAPKSAKTYFLLAITKGNLAIYRGGKEKVRLSRNVEKDAKKAIQLDPDYSPPYAALGVYYREVATLNWALKMFAKHLLGGLPDGTLADAEKMFRKAIEKDPGNVYAHYQLGLTYEEMDQPKKAVGEYHKVLELPIVDHQDPIFRKESRERLAKLG
jgi:Tfp pilus assembly protein PilF